MTTATQAPPQGDLAFRISQVGELQDAYAFNRNRLQVGGYEMPDRTKNDPVWTKVHDSCSSVGADPWVYMDVAFEVAPSTVAYPNMLHSQTVRNAYLNRIHYGRGDLRPQIVIQFEGQARQLAGLVQGGGWGVDEALGFEDNNFSPCFILTYCSGERFDFFYNRYGKRARSVIYANRPLREYLLNRYRDRAFQIIPEIFPGAASGAPRQMPGTP